MIHRQSHEAHDTRHTLSVSRAHRGQADGLVSLMDCAVHNVTQAPSCTCDPKLAVSAPHALQARSLFSSIVSSIDASAALLVPSACISRFAFSALLSPLAARALTEVIANQRAVIAIVS